MKISSFGTKYFVSVNGVKVFKQFDSDSQLTTVIPVNQWFHPSLNNVGLYLLPKTKGAKLNDSSFVRLDLQITDDEDQFVSFSIPILHFDGKGLADDTELLQSVSFGGYSLGKGNQLVKDGSLMIEKITKNDIKKYPGGLFYFRSFTIANSLPLWAFFGSDRLPDFYSMDDDDYYSALNSMFVEYEKIQEALKSKKIDSIIPMFSERNNETDKAFYLSPGTTENRLRDALVKNSSNPGLILSDLKEDYLGITVEDEAERKLVSLTRAKSTAAIAFDIKTGGSTAHPIILRKQNGKWIIAR